MTIPSVDRPVTASPDFPQPTFASVHVEFADGTFREFNIYKPLKTEVDVSTPHGWPPIDADLGVVPVGVIAPVLPWIKIRIQAGISDTRQVMSVDSRDTGRREPYARMLALLGEALELQRESTDLTDDRWRVWRSKAEGFLRYAL